MGRGFFTRVKWFGKVEVALVRAGCGRQEEDSRGRQGGQPRRLGSVTQVRAEKKRLCMWRSVWGSSLPVGGRRRRTRSHRQRSRQLRVDLLTARRADSNMSAKLWLCAFLAVYRTQTCRGFNLDQRFPVIKEGETKGSLFGFSVALHEQTVGSRQHL